MDDSIRDLQTARSTKRGAKQILAQEHTWMTRLRRTASGQEVVHTGVNTLVELSDVVYADDHDVIQPVEGWKEVKDNINLILDTQAAWGMLPNLDKSSVMVYWKGKGSRKKRRVPGYRLQLAHGKTVPVVTKQTHLGTVRTEKGTFEATVKDRCDKGWGAKKRYQRRILTSPKIRLATRVNLYKALVQPVLLYGLETAPLTAPQLQRLENVQMARLRAVTRQWRHAGGYANVQLRTQRNVSSVKCCLQERRLLWYREPSVQEPSQPP